MNRPVLALAATLIGVTLGGAEPAHAQHAHERGHAAGADRHALVHAVDILADGGRIELQSAGDGAADVAHIRDHLLQVTLSFGQAEPEAAALPQLRCMPGAATMIARREAITYVLRELPRGGEIRIVTQDAQALAAIHEFLSFQREHHGAAAAHGDRQGHDAAGHDARHAHSATQHDRTQHGGAHHGSTQDGCARAGGAHHGGM